jgi:hypothetical protein
LYDREHLGVQRFFLFYHAKIQVFQGFSLSFSKENPIIVRDLDLEIEFSFKIVPFLPRVPASDHRKVQDGPEYDSGSGLCFRGAYRYLNSFWWAYITER